MIQCDPTETSTEFRRGVARIIVIAITKCLIWVSSVHQFTAAAICLLTDHVRVTDT